MQLVLRSWVWPDHHCILEQRCGAMANRRRIPDGRKMCCAHVVQQMETGESLAYAAEIEALALVPATSFAAPLLAR